MAYANFKATVLGRKVGAYGLNDTSDPDFGQCVGLVMYWFTSNKVPFFYGNAKDLIDNAPRAYVDILGPNDPIRQGDVFVYGGHAWNGGFGHTGIIDTPYIDGIGYTSIEQNDPINGQPEGAPVEEQSRDTRFELIGIIRIKELDMQIFDEQARVDWNLILHGHDEGLYHECVGMEFKKAMYTMKDLPSFKHEVYANGVDIGYYLNEFAGHAPTAADFQALGVNPSGTGDRIGTQSHKQVIYELMKRPDVLAHQGNGNPTLLKPGAYIVP